MVIHREWFVVRLLGSVSSFSAIALRNFAVGWELVAFFPSTTILSMHPDVHLYGVLQLVLSFVLYWIGVMINKDKEKGE